MYLDLKEISRVYGVSSSTARRMYLKVRNSSDGETFNGEMIIKREPLPSGKFKVLMLKSYLTDSIQSHKKSTNQKSVSSRVMSSSGGSDVSSSLHISLLEEQINHQKQQILDQRTDISEYQRSFEKFQKLEERILKHIDSINQQNQRLEEEIVNQSHLLEQKNIEIQQINKVSDHRRNLLEQYSNKNIKKEQDKSEFLTYEDVVEVEPIKEDNRFISKEETTGKKSEPLLDDDMKKDFSQWMSSLK
jgi:hypothetical protein